MVSMTPITAHEMATEVRSAHKVAFSARSIENSHLVLIGAAQMDYRPLTSWLRKRGCHVYEVSSPDDLVAISQHLSPDVVIMDSRLIDFPLWQRRVSQQFHLAPMLVMGNPLRDIQAPIENVLADQPKFIGQRVAAMLEAQAYRLALAMLSQHPLVYDVEAHSSPPPT